MIVGSAGMVVALLVMLAQFFGDEPTKITVAGPGQLSAGEAAAGAVALGATYPGGLPALLGLFDTGECAGITSYAGASANCQSVLGQIVQLGAGRSFPATISDLAGSTDQTVPPSTPPDPSDQFTSQMISEMQADGAPPDLIAGLRQTPPFIPPAYDTWFGAPDGPQIRHARPNVVAPSSSTSMTVPPPPTTIPPSTSSIPPPTSSTPPTSSIPPPTSTTAPTTIPPTTTTPIGTTLTSPPPPPPQPPLLVAVGDSLPSGHVAQPPVFPAVVWSTICDNPGNAANPGTSWAGNLRALLGVPWNRYFNFAHSGSSTGDVIATTPYTNPCGVRSQPVRSQLNDAKAVLAANPSRAGASNVAVASAGINDTNWVAVARLVVRGATPNWAVANPGACTDWVMGNPAGNATPGAPAGAIPPAWDGAARSGGISANTAAIMLGLIGADPGAQVRQLLYYRWIRDPNVPPVCNPAVVRATTTMNGWISFGVLVARIVWALVGGNPNRIQAGCQQLWIPGPNFIQTRIVSWGTPNWALVPGWPHPNAAGNAALANCVNGTLARAPGGGVA